MEEIRNAVAALTTTLLAARDACRNRDKNPETWTAFEAAVRPHLNTLERYARKGQLDTNATDMLRSVMSDLMVYQSTAMHAPVKGRRR